MILLVGSLDNPPGGICELQLVLISIRVPSCLGGDGDHNLDLIHIDSDP